jgi:hypothetical protein
VGWCGLSAAGRPVSTPELAALLHAVVARAAKQAAVAAGNAPAVQRVCSSLMPGLQTTVLDRPY